VTSNRDRQRAAARAKLERVMTERVAAAQHRRRLLMMIGAGLLALVLVGTGWVVIANVSKKKVAANASPSASASASSSVDPNVCHWNPKVAPSDSPAVSPSPGASAAPSAPPVKGVVDVGTPPATGEPRIGIQTMTITTNLGPLTVRIDDAKVPCTAASFTYLASKKFFDNTSCHRLTTSGIYVLQCGDPGGAGTGGPTYEYGEENLPKGQRPVYPEGTIALANAGPGTNGSQFFIVYKDIDVSSLGPDYTVLGKVTNGMDIIKKVAEGGVDPAGENPSDGKPKTPLTIQSLTMSPPVQP